MVRPVVEQGKTMHEPIRNTIKEDDRLRCFICNGFISHSNPTYKGFMSYGVPIHKECHTGVAEFEEIKRGLTLADEDWPCGTAPDAVQPPEYIEARKWNSAVRARAEKEIAAHAATIPIWVIHRLNHLRSPGPLRDREFELVKMWSGVGVWTTDLATEHDFCGIREMMQNIAHLPGLHDYEAEWWLFDSGKIHYSALNSKDHKLFSESGLLLCRTLKTALAALVDDIPSPGSIAVLIGNREREKPEKERQTVRLTDVVLNANALEEKRSIVVDSEQRAYSIPEVADILASSGAERIEIDCGLIRSAADFEAAVETYGGRARSCDRCPNWFALAEGQEDSTLINTCPGCTVTDRPELPPGAVEAEDVPEQTEVAQLQGALF